MSIGRPERKSYFEEDRTQECWWCQGEMHLKEGYIDLFHCDECDETVIADSLIPEEMWNA